MNAPAAGPARACMDCGRALPEGHPGSVCVLCLWGDDGAGEQPAAPPASGVAALRVPGHDVREEIARGGMGIVYRAWERGPGREVALKMLRPQLGDDPDMRVRFRQETRTMAALEHPAILPVYRVDENEDLPFYTMKLASGGTLAARRADYAGAWRATAELVARLADAVHYAHSHGVLHRDIKPANVLFDENGAPYLSDFGLVKLLDDTETLTVTRDFLGTPHYSAPEVAAANAGHATVASDVWSLGAVFYELLAGHAPFDAPGVPALLRKIVEEPLPALPPAVPRDLGVICGKCMAKEPSQRYQNAGELADDLRRWLEGRSIMARPAGQAERAWRWMRRNPALSGLGAALVAALALLAGTLWREAAANARLLEESRARESALRQAEEASRKGEADATLAGIKARIRAGPWDARDQLLEAVAATPGLRGKIGARELSASLLALPQLVQTRLVPHDQRGHAGRPDPSFRWYPAVEGRRTVIREIDTGRLVAAVDAVPSSVYPAGPISPDGRLLLITGERSAALWDVRTRTVLAELPQLYVWNFFSADGRWLTALDMQARQVIVADLTQSPVVVRRIAEAGTGWMPQAISDDGRLIAAVENETGFGLRLVETATGRLVRELQLASRYFVHGAAFSPDGRWLYAAMIDGRVGAWDVEDARPRWVVTAHSGAADTVAVFDGGRHVVTQGRDGLTKVLEAGTGREVAQIQWSGRNVVASGDGMKLALTRDDLGGRMIYRLERSEVVSSCRLVPGLASNTFLRGGQAIVPWPDLQRFAVTSGHDVHAIGVDADAPLFTMPCGRIESIALDAAGGAFVRLAAGRTTRLPFERAPALKGNPFDRLVSGARRVTDLFRPRAQATRWDLPAVLAGRGLGPVKLAASTPGQRRLFLAGKDLVDELRPDPAVPLLWQPRPRPAAWRPLPDATALACTEDGARIALAGREQGRSLVRIMATGDGGEAVADIHLADAAVHAVAFTIPGDAIVVGGSNEIACLEIPSGKRRWMRPAQGNGGESRVAVSRDGRMVAALVYPEMVSVYDPVTGSSLADLRHPLGGRINAVAFSADSRHLAVLSGLRFHVWHLDALRRHGAMAARRE